MRRTRTLLIAATGTALALLLGSGLLALVSDSVTSPGNALASGTLAPTTGGHEVRAALIGDTLTDVCGTTTPLHDGPLSTAFSGETLDLSGSGLSQRIEGTEFCIRNDGTSTGRVRVAVTSIVGTELGPCEASELTAGDTTCGLAAAGELAAALNWTFLRSSNPHSSTSCVSSSAAPFDGTSTRIIDTDLAPGDTCRIFAAVQLPASTTETQKLRAQTDRLQFDIVFTLEDITVP